MFNRFAIIMPLALSLVAGGVAAAPALAPAAAQAPAATDAGLSAVAVSPSGSRYAIAAYADGKRAVHIVEGANIIKSVDLGDAKVNQLQWAGENLLMITITRSVNVRGGKIPVEQAGVVNLATGDTSFAFSDGPARTNLKKVYGLRNIDGHWYAFVSGATMQVSTGMPGAPDLYRMDMESGQITKVADGPPNPEVKSSWLVGPDGKVLVRDEYDANGRWSVYSGETRIVGPLPAGRYELSFGRSPDSFVYKTPEGHYMEVPVAGGAASDLLGDRKDATPVYDPYSQLLVGYRVTGAAADKGYHFLQGGNQGAILGAEKSFSGRDVTLVSNSQDFSLFVVKVEGGDKPAAYYLLDTTRGKATNLGPVYAEAKTAPSAGIPGRS